jgi:hypothetical protein
MNAATLLAVVALFLAGSLGYYWWRRSHQQSPSQRERQRRLALNAAGRLTDGTLVEPPHNAAAPDVRLLFFRYEVSGVEYTAAQDVSALLNEGEAASLRSGTVAAVKYDPRKPSNSIVICEQWSGLTQAAGSVAQPGSRTASGA